MLEQVKPAAPGGRRMSSEEQEARNVPSSARPSPHGCGCEATSLDPDGDVRGGIVLDDLAVDGLPPPMAGVLIDPGTSPGAEDPREPQP